jgi:hypothetical protein
MGWWKGAEKTSPPEADKPESLGTEEKPILITKIWCIERSR